jgi:tetratricopeptide (TPR) repeat protein
MKPVSLFALGLALSTSAVALVPTLAQAPKEAPANLSPAFRKSFIEAQAAQKAGNAADLLTKLTALDATATLPDEKYFAAVMRFEYSKLTKDRAVTRQAVNGMIASASPLMKNLPDLLFNSGALAFEAGDYADAVAKLTEADRVGSKDINRLVLAAESSFKLNQTAQGLAFLERAAGEQKAAGKEVPQDWYRRGLSVALKAKQTADITKWSRLLVQGYPTLDNWRDALVLYRDGNRLDPLVQLDVFRLMRQTASLKGERDFYDYAEVANSRALPGEGKAVIEEGFASNPALKSSRAVGEIYTLVSGKIAADSASVTRDEASSRVAKTGVLAGNTGNAYLAYGKFDKAIELLTLALTKGGVDADAVNTRLGIALTKSGNKAGARKAFAAVGGVRAEVARFWTLYLDLNP